MTATNQPWYAANLVALDLEGSGAQERGDEQILEIAAIRLIDGEPDMATAYTTCLDPGRPIPAKPWISPGLSGLALQGQPTLAALRGDLLARLTGAYLVGHNVGVDWRLLRGHLPDLTVAGLIDTHRLAKAAAVTGKLSLTDLLSRLDLSGTVTAAARHSRPHRALWDATGAALLMACLVHRHLPGDPTLAELLHVAGISAMPAAMTPSVKPQPGPAEQETLLN